MRSLQEVQQQLGTSFENGLAPTDVPKSQQLFGKNTLTPLPREPLWKKFLEKFDEPIIKILLAAALLSMIVDLFKTQAVVPGGIALGLLVAGIVGAYLSKQQQWIPSILFVAALLIFFLGLFTGHLLIEGMAVMIAVILATGVAFWSEYQSDREFELLNARKEALRVKVTRGGDFHTIPMEEVVVGDLVTLEMGDEIPADGRLVKANELLIDQSLMTGESNPVRKQARPIEEAASGPDQPGCLYRGTQVVDGAGLLCVTEVGDRTSLGEIARKLSAEDEEEEEETTGAPETQETRVKKKLTISKEMTPLQVKLTHLAELISTVGYWAAGLIFVALIFRGILAGTITIPADGAQAFAVFGELLDAFVLMVIIIVVAVPEGLPMSVTVSLALAMQKMTRANSLVRQLIACETIGSATVICSDKTGTLTQNRMQVDRICYDSQIFDRDRTWVKPEAHPHWPRDGKPLDWLALNAAVNSTANLEDKGGKIITVGNTTEGALLQYLRESGVDHNRLRMQFEPLYQLHFSGERKRMTTVIRYGDKLVALVKGAPEMLLEHCTHFQKADGTIAPLTEEAREVVQRNLRDAAMLAMRTLAFGYHILPPDAPTTEDELHAIHEQLEKELVFIGFVAIRDPLREDVKEAVAQCRAAGIEVKMVTGDNVETARAIAFNIGLVERADAPIDTDDAIIMTSTTFNRLDDEQLKQRLPRLRVLARALPKDKYRLVQLLQQLGEVVAVTGDGTNDAPALKKADVGLAMGIAGTEVAKEASKIVLLDDAFSTIVKAVHWGRSLYENIQRFIQFQLTINISALTIAFLGPLLFAVKAPFTVLQLLWINVIMDTFASIALCSEPPREGLMKMPPKKRDENILSPSMVRTIFVTGAFFVVVMLAFLVLMKGSPVEPGLFGTKEGPWSFESAGSRTAVPGDQLVKQGNEWAIKDTNPPQIGEVSFTLFQVSLFFSIYVFFQVWNQINCRSLTPEMSGLHRIWENPTFLTIASTVAIGQIVIVTFLGPIFKVEPLNVQVWLGIIAFTSSVLIFAEVARRVRMAMGK